MDLGTGKQHANFWTEPINAAENWTV
jgi:hypothetical protein